MQGYTLVNMYPLAGDFPPSVNTADDPSQLKKFESPACYGVDSEKNGRLASGSIPTGVTRDDATKTVGGNTYSWIYNRLWRSVTSTLYWGAPYYDDTYLPHGLGKLDVGNTIVDVQRALGSQLWLITASGSYFINNAKSMGESDFEVGQIVQELKTTSAAYALTLNGLPIVSNSAGVYLWTGNQIKELTRPVRNSLGSFGAVAIKTDYLYQKIIGTAKFAIDTTTGKLFDYGTSGFLYTTPTMKQARGNPPFRVNSIVLAYEMSSAGSATISWQSKAEDEDWFTEADIEIVADTEGERSRKEVEITNPYPSAHKYAFRITSMDSNVAIEEIFVNNAGYAVEAVAQ